ncbi:MAG: hypothetical protein HZC15_05130, partial [Candidatus Omnitrophica bacterium]|nr:hypothetical protein [Candidatus Omnitrophota bacterium]
MFKKLNKIIVIILSVTFIFQQAGFAQVAAQFDLSGSFMKMGSSFTSDKFRPLHLRYFSYDINSNNFKFLFDKGDAKEFKDAQFKESANELLKYFLIGIALPDKKIWVNLRPDSQDQIIETELEKTDLGKVLL